jgi:outer membrane protein insertion porin family
MNTSQLRLQPYAFFDAANTWASFETTQPTDLFRSTGLGVRLFLPIVGMLEVNYGRNLDTFSTVGTRESSGAPDWRFQFALGQSFGGN